MSGQAFNAMWSPPPPPSYTDTVDLDPADYVVLTTSHGDEALVHRDCLLESPVLRVCFRKRISLATLDVVVVFREPEAPAEVAKRRTSASSSTATNPRLTLSATVVRQLPMDDDDDDEGAEEGLDGGDNEPRASVLSEHGAATVPPTAAGNPRHAVTLTETLRTDNSVQITFPRLTGPQLEVVVAYLYFKHRYNRRPTVERPPFDVPADAALEVLRTAQALEC